MDKSGELISDKVPQMRTVARERRPADRHATAPEAAGRADSDVIKGRFIVELGRFVDFPGHNGELTYTHRLSNRLIISAR